MRFVLTILLVIFCNLIYANEDFKEFGKFNCKSSATIFPFETPKTIFQLIMETSIQTKEYDLSSTPQMSKAIIKMAYSIRRSSENTFMEQGFFKGESMASELPFPTNDYWSVHYGLIASTAVSKNRLIFLTIPDNFTLNRYFGIKLYIGEFNGRNTEQFTLSCENLNY